MRVQEPEASANAPAPEFITRIALGGDARTYYVAHDNRIFGETPGGSPTLVGTRTRASGDYLWNYHIDGRPYAVDRQGKVWATPRGSQATAAGRAQKLGARP